MRKNGKASSKSAVTQPKPRLELVANWHPNGKDQELQQLIATTGNEQYLFHKNGRRKPMSTIAAFEMLTKWERQNDRTGNLDWQSTPRHRLFKEVLKLAKKSV